MIPSHREWWPPARCAAGHAALQEMDCMELQPEERIRDLVVERKLSSSRIGDLYAVRNVGDGDRFLARVLRSAPSGMEIKLLEARLAQVARLPGTGIEPPAQLVWHQGLLVLLYPWRDATPLDALLAQGPQPVGVAVDTVARVAETLSLCHAQGLAHGNLTPASVLLKPDGQPWVLDLGVFSSGRILPGAGWTADLLDPRYASPEQLCYGLVDAGCDIFALGLLLYEIRFGSLPWPGSDWCSALARRRAAACPPADGPGVPGELLAVIRRATDPDPSRGYQGLATLLNDLRVAGFDLTSTRAIGVGRPESMERERQDAVPGADAGSRESLHPSEPLDDATGAISFPRASDDRESLPAAEETRTVLLDAEGGPARLLEPDDDTEKLSLWGEPGAARATPAGDATRAVPIGSEPEPASAPPREDSTRALHIDAGAALEETISLEGVTGSLPAGGETTPVKVNGDVTSPVPLGTETGDLESASAADATTAIHLRADRGEGGETAPRERVERVARLDTVGRIRLEAVAELELAEELERQQKAEGLKDTQPLPARLRGWAEGATGRLRRGAPRTRAAKRKRRLWARLTVGTLAALVVLVGVAGVMLTSTTVTEKPVPVSIRVMQPEAEAALADGWPREPAIDFVEIGETGYAETDGTGIVIAVYIDGSMVRLEPNSRLTLERSVRVVEQPGPLAPMLAWLLGQDDPRPKVRLELHSRLHRGEVLVRVPPVAGEEQLEREFLLLVDSAVARVLGTQFGARFLPDGMVAWKVDDGQILIAYVGTAIDTGPSGEQVQRTVAYVFALSKDMEATTYPWPARFAGEEGRQRVFVDYMRRILGRVVDAGRLDVDSREAPLLSYDPNTKIAVYDLTQALLAPTATPRPYSPDAPITATPFPTAGPSPTLPPWVTPSATPVPSPSPTDVVGGPRIVGTPVDITPTATPMPRGTGTPTPAPAVYGFGTPSPTPTIDPFALIIPPGYTLLTIDNQVVRDRLNNLTWNDHVSIQQLPQQFRNLDVIRSAEVSFMTGAVVGIRLPDLGGLSASAALRVWHGELRVSGFESLGLSEDHIRPWLDRVNNEHRFALVQGSSGKLEIVYRRW